MTIALTVDIENLPLTRPFRISRGVKTAADVVVVTVTDGVFSGRGEAVPYARYDETVEGVAAQIEAVRDAMEQGASREELALMLPSGAARNAMDCALWDREARSAGRTVADLAGWPVDARKPLPTAVTVVIGDLETMAADARALVDVPLIKVKVDAHNPAQQIEAVRRAAPKPRMIVDPNEAWSFDLLNELQPFLKDMRVDLLEQPLPAGEDEALEGFVSTVPICADESCHDRSDLARLRARYQAVNIKLDKTGGLTEAFAMLKEARALGFGVMTGCMTCSSLSIAPAMLIGAYSDFCDLDGAMLMQQDRVGGMPLIDGYLMPAAAGFWGDGR